MLRRYEVDAVLGIGGFGAVYRVTPLDAANTGPVALKVVHAHATDPQVITRLKDEASLLSMLRHPSIPTVHDLVHLEDGRWAMLMEYVPGQDLRVLLHTFGPLPLRAVLGVIEQIAGALDCAWNDPGPTGSLQLVHRDVKPSNLMLSPDGSVKLLDFGAARAEVARLTTTRTGLTLGTSRYMAPEAFAGAAGPYSDVFSLGMTGLVLLGIHSRSPLGITTKERYESTFQKLLARVEHDGTRSLFRDMLAMDAGQRPSARGIARRARTLLATLDGPTLAEWAAAEVDPSATPMESEDPTVGMVVAVTPQQVARSVPWRPMARFGLGALSLGAIGMIGSGLLLLFVAGALLLWWLT